MLRDPSIQAPAPTEAVKYVNKYLTKDPDTHEFMGKARPELDAAWHRLLNG